MADATAKWGVRLNRIEILDITPPMNVVQAMSEQKEAEQHKRAAILKSEGEQQAAINSAGGRKQAAVLEAEGAKQSAILRAEAQMKVLELQAEGEKKALELRGQGEASRLTSIDTATINPHTLAVLQLKALQDIASSENAKIVVPYEATSLMGAAEVLLSTLRNENLGDASGQRLTPPRWPRRPGRPTRTCLRARSTATITGWVALPVSGACPTAASALVRSWAPVPRTGAAVHRQARARSSVTRVAVKESHGAWAWRAEKAVRGRGPEHETQADDAADDDGRQHQQADRRPVRAADLPRGAPACRRPPDDAQPQDPVARVRPSTPFDDAPDQPADSQRGERSAGGVEGERLQPASRGSLAGACPHVVDEANPRGSTGTTQSNLPGRPARLVGSDRAPPLGDAVLGVPQDGLRLCRRILARPLLRRLPLRPARHLVGIGGPIGRSAGLVHCVAVGIHGRSSSLGSRCIPAGG